VSAKELLNLGAARLDQDLSTQPLALAAVHGELGDVYNEMGDNASALEHLDRALAGFARLGQERSREGIDALFHRGAVRVEKSDWAAARADLERCLELGAAQFGPGHRWAVAARDKLAFIHLQLGEPDKAMQMEQEALAQPV